MFKHKIVKALTIMQLLAAGNPLSPPTVRNRRNTVQMHHHTGYSVSAIEQLIPPLRKAGILTGYRGPGGGYELQKSLDQISLVEVSRALYPDDDVYGMDINLARLFELHDKEAS